MADIVIANVRIDEVVVQHDEQSVRGYFLLIETSTELIGYFGPMYKPYIATYLEVAKKLVGLSPLNTNEIWDVLWSAQLGGRTGLYMEFISAIDCALWDIKGKYFNCPVYQLLGGPINSEVPCYASLLGYDVHADDCASVVRRYHHQGYVIQKWALRRAHNRDIHDHIQAINMLLRDVENVKFAFDVLGSWSVREFGTFVHALDSRIIERPDKIAWLEEPFPSEMKIDSLSLTTSIALGEHLYNGFEFKEHLSNACVSIWQPDIGRCGGITEAVRILGLAKFFGKTVIPHGHNLYPAVHLAVAHDQSLLPYLEYHATIEPLRQCFYLNPLEPVQGSISAPTSCGIGVDLDESRIQRRRTIATDSSGGIYEDAY